MSCRLSAAMVVGCPQSCQSDPPTVPGGIRNRYDRMVTSGPIPQWIYHFGPGDRPELARNPDAWTEQDNLIAAAHFEYLKRAGEAGTVILAGRAQDGIGPAVVIFEAPTAESAETFMRSDPFVKEGLFSADLHPFRAAILRGGD